MKIIEQFLCGKSYKKECEDGIFVNKNYIAVIDGVTSKGEKLWNGKTSGAYAKDLLQDVILNMPTDFTAIQAITFLNQAIRKQYESDLEYFKTHEEERIQAVCILYSDYRKEIWLFGDCQCIVNTKVIQNNKKIDNLLSEIRSLYLKMELEQGKTIEQLKKCDTGRQYIMPFLKKQTLYANQCNEYGYDVLDGFEVHPDHCIIIPVKQKDEIVFASDGYPILCNTLSKSEKKLKQILKEDPMLMEKYKSTKGLIEGNCSFDDRAYIKFLIEKCPKQP